jgi:succinate dehydrogenase flavin-adding protein (antitoxin of CptAB toxin-antitoxin module)
MEKQVAGLKEGIGIELVKREDYQKLINENIIVFLSALDEIEKSIILVLLDKFGAMNSREVHFKIIMNYYYKRHSYFDQEQRKLFSKLLEESKTRFYNKLVKEFTLPSYTTVRKKLDSLYQKKLISKRVSTGKIKELYFLSPQLLKAVLEKRQEIINKVKKGETVDKKVTDLVGLSEFELEKLK